MANNSPPCKWSGADIHLCSVIRAFVLLLHSFNAVIHACLHSVNNIIDFSEFGNSGHMHVHKLDISLPFVQKDDISLHGYSTVNCW